MPAIRNRVTAVGQLRIPVKSASYPNSMPPAGPFQSSHSFRFAPGHPFGYARPVAGIQPNWMSRRSASPMRLFADRHVNSRVRPLTRHPRQASVWQRIFGDALKEGGVSAICTAARQVDLQNLGPGPTLNLLLAVARSRVWTILGVFWCCFSGTPLPPDGATAALTSGPSTVGRMARDRSAVCTAGSARCEPGQRHPPPAGRCRECARSPCSFG